MSESENSDSELDPRIQIELEKLNTTTDEINKLELEYDEAQTTFRMLLNESTRRLKVLSKKLGSCIEKARPYYEAMEVAKKAQLECQKAAVQFRKANEIHAAAKETVALAEQRFMSNKDEWQFDNAWQEMLNHATFKVMKAENDKAEMGREHQRRAMIFQAAEEQAKIYEEKQQKNIIKSRMYFEEKSLCQDQLNTQKARIDSIKNEILKTKNNYSQTLKQLEQISNEIHLKRQGKSAENELLKRPREPGVGAELNTSFEENYAAKTFHATPNLPQKTSPQTTPTHTIVQLSPAHLLEQMGGSCSGSTHSSLPDIDFELDKCEIRSVSTISSAVSERDDSECLEEDLNDLKLRFRELATRPVDGGEGQSTDGVWESELKTAADKMDHIMLMKECAKELSGYKSDIQHIS